MTIATHDLDFIRDVVRKETGNVWSENQAYLIESRLKDVAQMSGFDSIETLVDALKKAPALHGRKVAEGITVNETRFFRDMEMFDSLEQVILPQLVEARKLQRRLSIWSAACSTGQEPYSLAMLIAEKFPQTAGWDIQITACDINDAVLEKTKSATYSQFEVNRGLPVRMLAKYFERDGMNWRVKEPIRKQVQTRKHNLLHPLPVFGVDLVLIRNVLIYFDVPNKLDILTRVHRVVKPDGFVILGGGETLLGIDAPFGSENCGGITAYRPMERAAASTRGA